MFRAFAARACAWITLGLAAAPLGAQAPALRLPLDCAPGASCWIANHVDLDPGPQARDYTCGALSYEGHKGTDFALRDLAAMREGVPVLAAAAGTVLGVRDGVADRSVRELPPDAVKDRECGNGVRIDHGGGWHTQYCHLRRGSVAVRRGARVAAGQALGMVGLSGLTEYPHLHFGVSRGGEVVDPFRGGAGPGCGPDAQPLWEAASAARLPYVRTVIYNFGVAPRLPQAAEARDGAFRARALAPDAPALVVWADVFGAVAGDALRFEVLAPQGERLLERRIVFERTQARAYRAFARKRGAEPWSSGSYRVTIAHDKSKDAGAGPASVHFSFDIP